MKDTHPSEALDELFDTLNRLGAGELATEIRTVVARGTVKEVALEQKGKSFATLPYEPLEAYQLAVRLVLGAIDPVLMRQQVAKTLNNRSGQAHEAIWKPDHLEDVLFQPSVTDSVEWPNLGRETVEQIEKLAIDVVEALTREGDS